MNTMSTCPNSALIVLPANHRMLPKSRSCGWACACVHACVLVIMHALVYFSTIDSVDLDIKRSVTRYCATAYHQAGLCLIWRHIEDYNIIVVCELFREFFVRFSWVGALTRSRNTVLWVLYDYFPVRNPCRQTCTGRWDGWVGR